MVVSVALVATGYFAGTMQLRIDNLAEVKEQSYLKAIAEHILTSCGSPTNWGSVKETNPDSFGLGKANSSVPYEVDIDKISRLCNQNEHVLSYYNASIAARLGNIAFGISVAPIFQLTITLTGNETTGDATRYTFKVHTSNLQVQASLNCYAIARNYAGFSSNVTSSSGVGYVDIEIPNNASGPALLVVFARASFDERMTSHATYSFGHLADEPQQNNTYLSLSPLNYELHTIAKLPNTTIEDCYFFSYAHQSNLTSIIENTFTIPQTIDKSPIVLVVYGLCEGVGFVEWVSYPQLPGHFGADFLGSEENVLTINVTIKDVLYRLMFSFGDIAS
jgi:hypothetical protein